MKIEMGESLFYSWLRHVKECQIVQTNWKPSPSWQLQNEEDLNRFMDVTDEHFQNKYGYGVYKNNSLSQLLMQAEVDALGISLSDNGMELYAIDVAFHESGLNYGDRQETVMRVIKKFVRTALCLIGYFGAAQGEIIFASPKIHNAIINDLEPCTADLNALFLKNNYNFTARVIANDDFDELVLNPILIASDGVSDTSELFMRGYQLINMFGDARRTSRQRTKVPETQHSASTDTLSELKIGKIAQTFLREALENGKADDEEINLMRTKDYSKSQFGIDFPLLVLASEECDSARYYAKPFTIRGVQYRLCSQWFEVPANNDRPLLLSWLERNDAIA
ncbi:hypothetical protein [Dehalococcoides mccartyi]|uniref:hypothetical protein n=1 Tax=Dehalococcoides mccartyi TaxID=61435 RepID=UPI000870C14D|nr:hypothetical protein [Dehalococcoides mccartyi]AOV98901.1 hypothetical protein DCWBC2_0228 [Dehalococcoides mccartyi]